MADERSPELASKGGYRHGRLRRALGRVGALAGMLVVFTGAAATGVLLHLNVPPLRRMAGDVLHKMLHASLAGDVEVRGLDHLSLRRVAFREGIVLDPRGAQTLLVQGVEARYNALVIVKEVLIGRGPLSVTIDSLSIDHADVVTAQGPSTALTLAETFGPRAFGPPEPTDPRGRPFHFTLDKLHLGSAWIHGEIAEARPIDAEVRDMRGSFALTEEGIVIAMEPTSVLERRVLPEPIAGTLKAGIRTRDDAVAIEGGFEGQVGAIAASVKASMDGDRVVADVDVPRVTPEALRAFLPDPPLTRPVAVQVRADGTLPMLGVTARVAEADAPARSITVEGSLDLAGPVAIEVDVDTSGVDPQLFAPKAPLAAIDAHAQATIQLGEGMPRVTADVRTQPTQILAELVPGVDAHVELDGGMLHGSLAVHEEGAAIEGAFAMTLDQRARFGLSAKIPSMHAAPRLAKLLDGAIDGSAELRVKGSFVDGSLDARVESAFAIAPGKAKVGLRQGRISGHVHGPVDGLSVDASLHGQGLTATDRFFEDVSARVEGPVKAPRVSAALRAEDRTIEASAEIDPSSQAARSVRAHLRHGQDSAAIAVSRIQSQPGGVRLDGLSLTGAEVGAIHGSLAVGASGVTGAVRGEAVNVSRLADLAGLSLPASGLVSFDVALQKSGKGPAGSARGSGLAGHVNVDLEDGAFQDIRGISAHLAANLDGENLEADGMVRLITTEEPAGRKTGEEPCRGSVVSLKLEDAKAKVRGPIVDARTWTDLHGEGRLLAEDIDLRCLARRSPTPLPAAVSEIGGLLTVGLAVRRDETSRYPSVHDLSIKTVGLTVKGEKDPKTDAPAWESKALDLAVSGDFDGDTGLTRGQITVLDSKVLLDLSAATTLDLPALLGDDVRRARALSKSPIAAHLSIPRRAVTDFHTLPSIARDNIPAMTGEVSLDVYAAGTADEPRVAVRAMGFALEQSASQVDPAKGAGAWALPLDFDAAAFYDTHKGTLDAYVSRAGSAIAVLDAKVKAELKDLRARSDDKSIPWSGSAHLALNDLPLSELPYLADHDIKGMLRGRVAVEGLNEKPTISVDLSAVDLQMTPDLVFKEAKVALDVGPSKGAGDKAKLEARLRAKDGGRLDATADLGIRWKAGAVPMIDFERSAGAELRASRFRLAVAQPFLADTLSRLDGYLDGRLALSLANASNVKKGTLEGSLRVTQGIVEVPKLGQEFRSGELTLVAEPSGNIRIEKISARGNSGSFKGSGLVRLQEGELKSAHAELTIPKGQELPITLEGVPLGEARGNVAIDATAKKGGLDVAVKVPDFHLALPSSIGKSAQPLDPNKDITIVPAITPPEKKPEPKSDGEGGTEIAININLGDIQIEGNGIDVTLTENDKSRLRILLNERTQIAGGIKIVRGKVEVLGKVFEIEAGSLVSLRPEDPSNPFLNVTASWDAPEGTRVFIDYIGGISPITPEKVKFRSDPPKSKQEIISLLLFGPDYEQGTLVGGHDTGPPKDARETATGAAASVGSSYASEQLTQVLHGIAPLQGLSVKLSANEGGGLQTSLGYKLGRDVTATASFGSSGSGSVSHEAGGSASQTSAPNSTAVGVEWRFRPHWSLKGSVDVGTYTSTGLDLLWTKRY